MQEETSHSCDACGEEIVIPVDPTKSLFDAPAELVDGLLLRSGKGASLHSFEYEDLTAMLRGTETEFLAQIEELVLELARAAAPESKALIRKQIKELWEQMRDAAQRNFLDEEERVVNEP